MSDDEEDTFEYVMIKTHVLKVHIHCSGCMRKVKKLLRQIEGVYEVEIDSEEHKVTVSGEVDCKKLINKLSKSGKHAEVWPTDLSDQPEEEAYLNDLDSYESDTNTAEDENKWLLETSRNDPKPKILVKNEVEGWKDDLTNNQSSMERSTMSTMNFPNYGNPSGLADFGNPRELARPTSIHMGLPAYGYYGQPPEMMSYTHGPWFNNPYNAVYNNMSNAHMMSGIMENGHMHQPRMMMHPWEERHRPVANQYWSNHAGTGFK